jgi:membrane protein required for colicin V production
MSTLDIILALFLSYFAFKGFSNGFIVSIATLIGLVIGFYAATHFSEFTANWLKSDLGLESSNIKLIAYIVTFAIVVVLIFLLGRFLTGVVKTVGLGIVNRLAGAIFGIAKGALIVSFLFMFLSRIDSQGSLLSAEQKNGSVLYKPVSMVAPATIPLVKKYTTQVEELIQDKGSDAISK